MHFPFERKRIHQIELTENDLVLQLLLDLVLGPARQLVEEMLLPLLRDILQLFIGIDASHGLLEHLRGNVRGQHLRVPLSPLHPEEVRQHHGDHIRLLPRRGRAAPDPQILPPGFLLLQPGEHLALEKIEMLELPHEISVVGGQEVHQHLLLVPCLVMLHRIHELVKCLPAASLEIILQPSVHNDLLLI